MSRIVGLLVLTNEDALFEIPSLIRPSGGLNWNSKHREEGFRSTSLEIAIASSFIRRRRVQMHKLGIMLLLIGTIFSGVLHADEVTLKNGDRLSGTILKADAKVLVMKSEFAGEVSIQWEAITSLQSGQPLYFELKDGEKIAGTVATSEGKFVLTTKNAGTVTTSKDSVAAVRNETEETALNAEIDRLRNPHLTDFWSGFLDTGLSVTRGNSETLNFALSGQAVRQTSRDTITAYGSSIFANNGTAGPTTTTANSIGGGIRVDVNIANRLYVYGLTDFYHDEFQQLDLRNILGGGLGYHVIRTKPTTFDVYGGGDFNQSYYSTPLTRRTGEIMAGEYLSHSFSNRMTFDERFEFFPNISDGGQYRYTFSTHAVTKLSHWLGWQVSFVDLYVSNPPAGVKNNDLILSTGLRLTFGGEAKK
jgi:putative salt-induced outer membrane protein YdiY